MHRRLHTTAAALLLTAGLALTGCTGSSGPEPATTTAASEPAPTPEPTGISKECADAVYDMLIEEIKTGEVPDHRPESCGVLTDKQWSNVVDEQADKLMDAGEAAIEDSYSDDSTGGGGDGEDATEPSKVTYKVWGDAPAGVDITYGTDSQQLQGGALPMEKTLDYKPDALYWHITAQLTGGGDIRCSVTVDGETKEGRAQGGYNICSAQINNL